MYADIDTTTLRAIWTDVKTIKETGKLPDWFYSKIHWADEYEKLIMMGRVGVCLYEFCLQSMEPAKTMDDWLDCENGYLAMYAAELFCKEMFLKIDHVPYDLTIRHSRSIRREKGFRSVLQPQIGRRYEHKTSDGFCGLTVQEVLSLLKAVGVRWKRDAGVRPLRTPSDTEQHTR